MTLAGERQEAGSQDYGNATGPVRTGPDPEAFWTEKLDRLVARLATRPSGVRVSFHRYPAAPACTAASSSF